MPGWDVILCAGGGALRLSGFLVETLWSHPELLACNTSHRCNFFRMSGNALLIKDLYLLVYALLGEVNLE